MMLSYLYQCFLFPVPQVREIVFLYINSCGPKDMESVRILSVSIFSFMLHKYKDDGTNRMHVVREMPLSSEVKTYRCLLKCGHLFRVSKI